MDYRNEKYSMYPQNQPEERDDFCKRLKKIERELSMQDKKKVSYENFCNKPIHPSVFKKEIPFKFEIPKIELFKGKADPKEHLR